MFSTHACWCGRDSRGLQCLIFVNGIPLSPWSCAGSKGQVQSDVGHLFPHLLSFFWCVSVWEECVSGRHTLQRCLCMCVHCDWCDRCNRWTGTARCCFSRGQMPTCHWFVLMLTRGADSAHLIDHKMAASWDCRWCCRHTSFPLSSPLFSSVDFLYLYLAPPSIMCASRNTKKLPSSCYFLLPSHIHTFLDPRLHHVRYMWPCLPNHPPFHTVIPTGTLHA